ncbi:hypothetical protein [Vibrio rotiferianus]|uniref:hypothetical protein n=2 Tax=Vibrio TaxID=662 RepID=UPI0003A8F41B|nr:hypothetical protein [Vibrio rotiferianus]PIB14226.1 hypothetical protein B853_16037 [Vibrio rotiferianus CAIM 577 = LMG 21460]PIB14731.1 hypothetical protein B853_15695 [Vibrio rotiferianus CAIM 577 = LMG 21460]
MNKSVLALVMGSVLALSGCDNSPVGVSGGSETGSSSSSSQGVDTSKELNQSKAVTVMVARSLAPLITETATDLYGRSPGKGLNWQLIKLLYEVERGTEEEKQKVIKELDALDLNDALKDAPQIQQDWVRSTVNAIRGPSGLRGEIIASAVFAYAANPIDGWPKEALKNKNVGRFDAAVNYYLVLAANAGMEAIAQQVSYASYGDRQKAKQSIRVAMNSKEVRAAILDTLARGYTEQPDIRLDFTGSSAPVHFWADSDSVEGNTDGLSIVRNGAQYYGKGYISGESYEVLVSRSKGATMTKSSTSSIGSESTQSTTGGANVKAGQ